MGARLRCVVDGNVHETAIAIKGLARISHTTKCIGAPNQRKLLCRNNLRLIQGAPRCRQSVAWICLDLHLLKDAKWWRRSTAARSMASGCPAARAWGSAAVRLNAAASARGSPA